MEWISGTISNWLSQYSILFVGIILLIVLAHILLFTKKSQRYKSEYYRMQEQEQASQKVLQHRDLLHDRYKNYEQSLSYAQRIQNALFITPKQLRAHFPESFIFHRPKDIVSGDFNWARRINGKMLFSVADCTGHGVPGGFMSMIVGSILKQINDMYTENNPAYILKYLNAAVKKQLGQSRKNALSDDGLDMGLCYINSEKELYFSGAKFNLYYVEDGSVQTIQGDKMSIGYKRSDEHYQFTNHKLSYQSERVYYLFSDGIVDQKGGEDGFSYSKKRLQELLLTINTLDGERQKQMILKSLAQYQGSFERNDDITMVGFKL